MKYKKCACGKSFSLPTSGGWNKKYCSVKCYRKKIKGVTMKFKDVKEGESFMFKGELYIKTSENRALGLGGGKSFSGDTEVDKE